MSNATILTMLENISQSLYAVQNLILGSAYVFGIGFVLYALLKFFEQASSPPGGQSRGIAPPFYYLIGGVLLIYFPSSLRTLANTAFGSSQSILQYTTYTPYTVYDSVRVIIHTAGLLWFMRGTIFLMQSGQPGGQDQKKSPGKKGIAYLCASVCATNFDYAVAMTNWIIELLMKWF
jgi:hypothetical protein